jgi:rhamnosyltransferase
MSDPFVSIILRSYNEGWALAQTLAGLQRQEYRNWELIVFDSGSTDGSVELLQKAQPAHFIQLAHGDYKPGRVLNHGVRLAKGDPCIFLNADATPQGADWLRPLVSTLLQPGNAAAFSRQIPRPDCLAVYASDYDRCFGNRRASAKWDHFFSMVSSGLRKDVWSKRGFLEHLQYAEDDEYTRWCKARGYQIIFCPESVVIHSHNYTAEEAYKRTFGDAKALGLSSAFNQSRASWLRVCALGWLNDLRADVGFCFRNRRVSELPLAARIRWWQRRGKLDGYRTGAALASRDIEKSHPGPATA